MQVIVLKATPVLIIPSVLSPRAGVGLLSQSAGVCAVREVEGSERRRWPCTVALSPLPVLFSMSSLSKHV